MPQPGLVGHGVPPRPTDVQRALRDLQRQLDQLHGGYGATLIQTTVTANTAAASATAPGAVSQSASSFAVPTAGAYLISTTVTVPTGYSSATIALTGRVFALNPGASDDYLYCRLSINGTLSTAVPVLAPAGVAVLNVAAEAMVLNGLSSPFTVALWASSNSAGWAANASNVADIAGSIVWFGRAS